MMMRRRSKKTAELLQLTVGAAGPGTIGSASYTGNTYEIQFSLHSPDPSIVPSGALQIFVNDELVVEYDVDRFWTYNWNVGPEIGTYRIRAVYSGDSVYAPAESEPVELQIDRATISSLTAPDAWTMEGEPIPPLTPVFSGFVTDTPPTGSIRIFEVEADGAVDTFAFTYGNPITITDSSPLYGELNSLDGHTGSYGKGYCMEYLGDSHYYGIASPHATFVVYEKSSRYEIGYSESYNAWCMRPYPFEDPDGVEHYPTGTVTISLEETSLSKTFPVNTDGSIFNITEPETDVFTAEELATLSNGTYYYHITYSGDTFFKPYDGRGVASGASGLQIGKTEVINRTHTLTIHYVDYDDNTVKISDDYVATFDEGQEYNIASPSPDRFYESPNPSRVEGTMGTEDIVETVTYKRRTCNVLIQYKFTSGGNVAPDYTATVPMGEDFDVESPVIEGYIANYPTVTVDTSRDVYNRIVLYTPDPNVQIDPID